MILVQGQSTLRRNAAAAATPVVRAIRLRVWTFHQEGTSHVPRTSRLGRRGGPGQQQPGSLAGSEHSPAEVSRLYQAGHHHVVGLGANRQRHGGGQDV